MELVSWMWKFPNLTSFGQIFLEGKIGQCKMYTKLRKQIHVLSQNNHKTITNKLFLKSMSITQEKHLKLHYIANKPRQFVVEFLRKAFHLVVIAIVTGYIFLISYPHLIQPTMLAAIRGTYVWHFKKRCLSVTSCQWYNEHICIHFNHHNIAVIDLLFVIHMST